MQQIKALSAKGMVVNRNRSREGVLTVNTPNVNYGDAVCNCAKKLQSFDALGCKAELSSDAKGETGVERCVDLVNELNRKSPSCVCPIDPNSYGTCGVPVNLDLYTGKRINGLQVPMPINSAGDDTNFLQLGDSSSINDEVDVQGLDANEHKALKSWVVDTVRKNAKVVDGAMVWEDTIPKEHGQYIRDHCDQLDWSVRKAGLTVAFKGLTYSVAADGTAESTRRRRLLGRSQNGGC